MNSHERKMERDAHVKRLGGLGALVTHAGRFPCRLISIHGHNTAEVQYINRTTIGGTNVWPVKADKLQPGASV